MQLFRDKKTLCVFALAIVLWALLPASTLTTRNTGFIQVKYGYLPVAEFYKHHSPPKVNRKIFKEIVWRHKRFSVLWLPFWGEITGEYGLYGKVRYGKSRVTVFIPLTLKQAQAYADAVKIKLPETSPTSYWSLYFGWLVVGCFGLIFYWDRSFFFKLRTFL